MRAREARQMVDKIQSELNPDGEGENGKLFGKSKANVNKYHTLERAARRNGFWQSTVCLVRFVHDIRTIHHDTIDRNTIPFSSEDSWKIRCIVGVRVSIRMGIDF
jgi:hypothetical protein